MSDNFNKIVIELSRYAKDLAVAYTESCKKSENMQGAMLSKSIVSVLYRYRDYLALMSKMHKGDLEDCLLTYTNKYLEFLESINFSKHEIEQYRLEIEGIINATRNHVDEFDLTISERDISSLLMYKITHNAQSVIAQPSDNQASKDTLLASSIVYGFSLLNQENQTLLFNRLSLVKEIWNIETLSQISEQTVKYEFYQNIENHIDLHSANNADEAFDSIINFFAVKNNVLEQLDDVQLIHLYDRLKNIDSPSLAILNIISLVHTEACYRYSYNRLTDTGYELLNRFQNFDALTHQVDDFEFAVIESYLLNSSNSFSLILQRLINKGEYLKELALTKEEHLLQIIEKINTKILNTNKQEQQVLTKLLDILQNKLDNPLDIIVQKKFHDLDNYTVNFLKRRYKLLLANINNLFESDSLENDFLRESFALKLASGYYLPNLSSSITKIRKMTEDRKEVKDMILELNLIQIFTSPDIPNKITSLDFKNLSLSAEVKSPIDYVHLIVKNIVSNCSNFQLEILNKFLLGINSLTSLQSYLKEEVTKEALKRSSIGQKFLSIILGKKNEYDCLERIIGDD